MSDAHQFHPTILREYDIRGPIGDTLGPEDARAIGRAFGSMVVEAGGKRVAVGYDGRLSSPELELACVDGLKRCGLEVLRIGLGPTPMLYFAVFHLKLDGGIMITGSHNPPDMNGFKMMLGKKAFYGPQIQRIGALASSGSFASGDGEAIQVDVSGDYVARLRQDYHGRKPLKVAWDAGNGSSGDILVRLVEELPGEHILLNERIDGTFPAHHPDPTVPANLVQLQEAVRANRCDLGIAFDGDGDRIGVVDGGGHILWADQLLVLLARDVLRTHPGATIIADVKASQVLFDGVAKAGGKPLMFKTGHSLIKDKMAELQTPLAGEMSGHIFYADGYYGYDDALYVAIRTLRILANADESLESFRKSLPQVVNTPELRFDCPDERKFKVVEEVAERLRQAGASVNDIDGVRVSTPDGWWLLRSSNTQAVLVARCEASSDAGLLRLKAQLDEQLRQSGIAPPSLDATGGH
jgi:phosphomannomutase